MFYRVNCEQIIALSDKMFLYSYNTLRALHYEIFVHNKNQHDALEIAHQRDFALQAVVQRIKNEFFPAVSGPRTGFSVSCCLLLSRKYAILKIIIRYTVEKWGGSPTVRLSSGKSLCANIAAKNCRWARLRNSWGAARLWWLMQ